MSERNGSPREPLPDRRGGFTQKVHVGGQTLYLRTGNYDDGALGEFFLNLSKSGTTLQGFASALAIAVSIGLQHGVPLDKYVRALRFMAFPPSGDVTGSGTAVRKCSSIPDYVMQELEAAYLSGAPIPDRPPPPDPGGRPAGYLPGPERSGA